jgi:hypothetical protein
MYWDPEGTFRVKVFDSERIAVISTERMRDIKTLEHIVPLTKDEVSYYCTIYHEEREREPSRYAKWSKNSKTTKPTKSSQTKSALPNATSEAVNLPGVSGQTVYKKLTKVTFKSHLGEFHTKIGPNIRECDCKTFKEKNNCRHIRVLLEP